MIAQGDEAAFGELFYLYLPRLKPMIYKMVKTEAVVNDLLQEVFMHLWLDREKLVDVESPSRWIFRIMFNRTLNWLEQQAVRSKARQQFNGEVHSNETEQQLAFAETSRLVQQAIAQLPPQAKSVYILSRQKGMKAQEIADKMGLSLQTVKNTLVRASKAIREHLVRHGILLPLLLLNFFSRQ